MPVVAKGTETFAELLVSWRSEHGLRVSEAARRAGVQPRTWLSWESGTEPQLSVLPGLAAALGVQCTDLLALLPTRLAQHTEGDGNLATAVRAWRRREAMSLGRAARRLGVAPSTVLSWESGKLPRTCHLSKLIAAGVVPR
jgi:transcriptional regulator with XRE-family HTH domain